MGHGTSSGPNYSLKREREMNDAHAAMIVNELRTLNQRLTQLIHEVKKIANKA
jgi:hypothetical protein